MKISEIIVPYILRSFDQIFTDLGLTVNLPDKPLVTPLVIATRPTRLKLWLGQATNQKNITDSQQCLNNYCAYALSNFFDKLNGSLSNLDVDYLFIQDKLPEVEGYIYEQIKELFNNIAQYIGMILPEAVNETFFPAVYAFREELWNLKNIYFNTVPGTFDAAIFKSICQGVKQQLTSIHRELIKELPPQPSAPPLQENEVILDKDGLVLDPENLYGLKRDELLVYDVYEGCMEENPEPSAPPFPYVLYAFIKGEGFQLVYQGCNPPAPASFPEDMQLYTLEEGGYYQLFVAEEHLTPHQDTGAAAQSATIATAAKQWDERRMTAAEPQPAQAPVQSALELLANAPPAPQDGPSAQQHTNVAHQPLRVAC